MISISMNVDQVIANLDDLYKRQLPFALSKAINKTALDIQAAIRQRIFQRGFTVRSGQSATWLSNLIKINRGDFATKERMMARVSVGKGFSQGDRSTLLPFLEEGGIRTSRMQIGTASLFAAGSVAIPLRHTPNESIPRALYPSNLGLQDRRDVSGAITRAGRGKKSRPKAPLNAQLKGSQRTFIVRTKAGEGLIFQRIGSGKRDLRGLFTIKPSARVPGRQFFYSTALKTASAKLQPNFLDALALAMRTAR